VPWWRNWPIGLQNQGAVDRQDCRHFVGGSKVSTNLPVSQGLLSSTNVFLLIRWLGLLMFLILRHGRVCPLSLVDQGSRGRSRARRQGCDFGRGQWRFRGHTLQAFGKTGCAVCASKVCIGGGGCDAQVQVPTPLANIQSLICESRTALRSGEFSYLQ
jgi:hypothetical protein